MAHVYFIRAAIAGARRDLVRAVALLDKATEAFTSADMFSHAAATRRRRGELLGGDEGQALVEESNAWMTSQGIQNPPRMTAMYAPGFPD
jgi:eukaryotic-like serine/threonine-protein kinase